MCGGVLSIPFHCNACKGNRSPTVLKWVQTTGNDVFCSAVAGFILGVRKNYQHAAETIISRVKTVFVGFTRNVAKPSVVRFWSETARQVSVL